MADLVPSSVPCCRCSRQFPIRAQMNLDSGNKIPMLVVLLQVDSVDAALEAATCQLCLDRQGPVDRGLYEMLKSLGLKDEEDSAVLPREAVVVRVREERAVPTVGVVVSDSRPREVVIFDPLMGTSIQTAHQEPRKHDRRSHGSRRDDWRPASSGPRLPAALREPGHTEPRPMVEPLTGAIGAIGGNKAVLEQAQQGIRQRDEAHRLERAQKFDKLLFYLCLALARIHKNAATSEVWDLVDTFLRKLGEAVSLDPQQNRGKKGVLAVLGTSSDELESLCLQFYQKPSVWTRKPGTVSETIDAFEGGRRPEFWDLKGGKKPAFYQLEVVRPKSSLPVPNPPLPGGDEDPRPRIVYPEGGRFGPDFTAENSRRLAGVESQIDELVGELTSLFERWLAIAHEDIGIGAELGRIDLTTHLPTFFAELNRALAEEAAEVEEVAEATEPTTPISLDLPANT